MSCEAETLALPTHLSSDQVSKDSNRLVGATGQLLFALSNHEAAIGINPISDGPNLNTEHQRITGRISRHFDYNFFRPLILLIL